MPAENSTVWRRLQQAIKEIYERVQQLPYAPAELAFA